MDPRSGARFYRPHRASNFDAMTYYRAKVDQRTRNALHDKHLDECKNGKLGYHANGTPTKLMRRYIKYTEDGWLIELSESITINDSDKWPMTKILSAERLAWLLNAVTEKYQRHVSYVDSMNSTLIRLQASLANRLFKSFALYLDPDIYADMRAINYIGSNVIPAHISTIVKLPVLPDDELDKLTPHDMTLEQFLCHRARQKYAVKVEGAFAARYVDEAGQHLPRMYHRRTPGWGIKRQPTVGFH